jgi:hypothetical protein
LLGSGEKRTCAGREKRGERGSSSSIRQRERGLNACSGGPTP